MNVEQLWIKPFATPMVERSFEFIRRIVESSHPGAVIYAPTGTGKSSFISLMLQECASFHGSDGTPLVSTVISVNTNERYVMSEGGFWGWLLYSMKHDGAKRRLGPLEKRFLVYEHIKDLAGRNPSGRVLLFIDEAQKLGLEELGLVADLLDELARSSFRLVVFLVGSYHLEHWKADLQTPLHSAVRRRFFTKEHPLTGLTDLDDFRRCLRRYDVDPVPVGGQGCITQFYQPKWFLDGGRLEAYASQFVSAFAQAVKKTRPVEVPMAFFCLALQDLLQARAFPADMPRISSAVKDSGFSFNYEPPSDS